MTNNILKSLVPREGLYCVWIRVHEGENAPLIQVWIDPSMTKFEPRTKTTEPAPSATPFEIEAAVAPEGASQVAQFE